MRGGGRRGQQVLTEICARQIGNCNCLQRSLTPPATGVAAGTGCISQDLLCSQVQLPHPRDPQGGRARCTMSQSTSYRSVPPSVRMATTTDTNRFSCCQAAEVTRTTGAQTRSFPLSGPLRSQLGILVGMVCVHSWYCHNVCDACSMNKEHHYLELSSLRHSLQESGGGRGGGDNYQLKPDFTGRSTTTIQALRDFTREPETLPAAVAGSIPSFSLEKQQLARVC